MDKIRILAVDDEMGILSLIKSMLDQNNFIVNTALNARDALTAVLKANSERTPFQLILTDIRMPGMSGLGLLHNLRCMEPAIKVLAMTGYTDSGLPAQLKQCGCLVCLVKPFDKNQLLDAIGKTLS